MYEDHLEGFGDKYLKMLENSKPLFAAFGHFWDHLSYSSYHFWQQSPANCKLLIEKLYNLVHDEYII